MSFDKSSNQHKSTSKADFWLVEEKVKKLCKSWSLLNHTQLVELSKSTDF